MRARIVGLIGVICLAVASARAEDVPVVAAGREAGRVYLYTVGDQRYLDAKQAVAAYGGHFDWQPVSGKVQLSVRGRQALLTVDSKRARVVDAELELPEPVMVRANTVLVPVEFFLSARFGEMTWTKTQFDVSAPRLQVDPRSSVGPLRWFSYKDHTRVVVELAPTNAFSIARRGRLGLEVTIPLGTIDISTDVAPRDGVVENVRLRQEPKLARLSIELAETSPKAAWDTSELSDPRRLVIDVYPDPAALERAKAGRNAAPKLVKGDATAPRDDDDEEPEAVPATGAAADKASLTAVARGGALGVVASPKAPPQAVMKRRIVIDPGHGGRDYGATGRRGVREKDVNLLAAQEVVNLLRKDGSLDVMLTRDRDVFVPLADRSQMANDFGADLFVSLHCNANTHRTEKGFEIYFLSERASDPEAQRVAEMENASLALEAEGGNNPDAEAAILLHSLARTEFINDASLAAGMMSQVLSRRISLPDRGVKQAAFYVLRGTNAPALLVEMGFVSNAAEETQLDSKRFRGKLAEGIYEGIVEFAKRQDWITRTP